MQTNTCLSDEKLRSYALGQMGDEEAERVSAHLADCAICEETMAGFDDTVDSMMHNIRVAAEQPANVAESDVMAVALQQVASLQNHSASFQSHPPSASEAARDWIRDYRLISQLGSGGMGTVYRAVHEKLQRTVALKVLPARRLGTSDTVERFEREMRAIGCLNHPAIVRATDAGAVDGTHFLAMDYVQGIDLSRMVRLTGPLSIPNACEVIRQAAIGLQYAHDQGLIHRDVKPGNIMLEQLAATDAVTVKVLDLGLALFGSASEAVDDFTTVGQLMGTLDYMAPEQADNSHDVGVTADVYSLGATMFKLLTGTAPFETAEYRSPLRKMKALATVVAPGIRDRDASVPQSVADVVDRMLLPDPADRYPTAADVAGAVTPLAADHNLSVVTAEAVAAAETEQEQTQQAVEAKVPVAAPPVPTEVPVLLQGDNHSSRRRFPRWMWLAWGLPVLLLTGSIIWVSTDYGTLRIESSVPDLPITIRETDGSVQKLTVTTGSNSVRVRSGRHEILLPVEHNEVSIDADTVNVRRGDVAVVKIFSPDKELSPAALVSPNERQVASRPPFNPATYRLGPGDLVGVYVEGVTGKRNLSVPLSPREKNLPPVVGLPFVVQGDGTIPLPFTTVDLSGATVTEAAVRIRDAYTTEEILKGDVEVMVTVIERRTRNVEQLVSTHRIQAGDTLGIMNGSLLWNTGQPAESPPVYYPDNSNLPAAIGLAYVVKSNGTIDLPIVGDVEVEGLKFGEAATAIDRAYTEDNNIFADALSSIMVTLMQPATVVVAETESVRETDFSRPQSNEPLFDGRTFDEWLRMIRIERSPEQLTKTLDALTTLGMGSRDAEVVDAILDITDRYPCPSQVRTPEDLLACAAIRCLRQLDPKFTADVLTNALRTRSLNTCNTIMSWLCSYAAPNRGTGGPFSSLYLGNADPLRNHLQESTQFVEAAAETWARWKEAGDKYVTHDNLLTLFMKNWDSHKPAAAVLDCCEQIVLTGTNGLEDIAAGQFTEYIIPRAAFLLATYRPDFEVGTSIIDSVGEYGPSSWWQYRGLALQPDNITQVAPALLAQIKQYQQLRSDNALPQSTDGGFTLQVGDNAFMLNSIFHMRSGNDWYADVDSDTLAFDLLGLSGTNTPEVHEVFQQEFERLLGQKPNDRADSGDYEPATRIPELCQQLVGQEAPPLPPGKILVARDAVRLQITLRAWERITGAPARFSHYPKLVLPSEHVEIPTTDLPVLKRFKGRDFKFWQDISDCESESPELLRQRLAALKLTTNDAAFDSTNPDIRRKLMEKILSTVRDDDEYYALMREVIQEYSLPNAGRVITHTLQNASTEQQEAIVEKVLRVLLGNQWQQALETLKAETPEQ